MNAINQHPQLPDFIQNRLNFFTDDIINSTSSGKHLVLGKKPLDGDIFLQNNDYLNLANNDDIVQSQIESLQLKHDSPVMSGVFLQNEESKPNVELDLARFLNFDSCLITQSGWSANVSLLQAICDSETHVYIDFLAHMSLWEGARITNSNIHPFMHNNIRHLKRMIRQNGPGIIVVDSIYSTIGTAAPLEEIVECAEQNNCAILVDESHSLGTHGPEGSGLVSELGLSKRIDFITASLAKTFAYRAGAIWCNNNTNSVLPFVAYPAIFSSAMLPNELDRIAKTLDVIQHADSQRKALHRRAKQLIIGLKQIGFTVRSESQIVALETGDEKNTELVRDFLEALGVFGAIFCRPATPANKNIIRFSVNSGMTEHQIEHIIDACRKAYHAPDMYFI